MMSVARLQKSWPLRGQLWRFFSCRGATVRTNKLVQPRAPHRKTMIRGNSDSSSGSGGALGKVFLPHSWWPLQTKVTPEFQARKVLACVD